jgi:predicted ATP-grasp superfamily ATP-dependent carboligase
MKILVFSGYNPRAIISFCRVATQYNLDFDIIASSVEDDILKTDYIKHVKLVRNTKNIDIDIITEIVDSYRRQSVFILPSTEYLNRILISNKKLLNDKNVFFGLVHADIYELVSDKIRFNDLCKQYEIQVPFEYESIPEITPFVIKPKTYFGSDNTISTPYIVFDKADLPEYLSPKNTKDFYFQEYVAGDSIYFLFYFTKDGKYNVFSQQNYIQQPNGGSILFAKSSNHYTNSIVDKFTKMFNDINFSGLVMVELRYTNKNWVMIEANPRLWGPSQLILDSGMDLFDLFLFDNMLIDEIKPKTFVLDTQYVWSGGITDNVYRHDGNEAHKYDTKFDIYNHTDTIKLFTNE